MNTHPEYEDISSSSKPQEPQPVPTEDLDEPTILFSSLSTNGGQESSAVQSPYNDDDLFLFGDEKTKMSKSTVKTPTKTYSKAQKRKARRNIAIFNIITSFVLAISVLITGVMGVVGYYTGDMNTVTIEEEKLGISEQASKLPGHIVNIALFGIDSRDTNAHNRSEALSGRSDSIIIVSINTYDNTIKLSSILRDSWVDIANTDKKKYGFNKINAAYSLGGASLAIKTLNETFELNVKDYVSVSLYQLIALIDIMGGVDIYITEGERKELNRLAKEEGFNVDYLYDTGLVHLNGGQAMIYSRIRKIDGTETRDLRQQKVLNCLFEKLQSLDSSQYPTLLKLLMPYVETSLQYQEILDFAPMLAQGHITLQSQNFPRGNGKEGALGGIFPDTNNGWVWKIKDLDALTDAIHKWIYG